MGYYKFLRRKYNPNFEGFFEEIGYNNEFLNWNHNCMFFEEKYLFADFKK